LQQNETEKRTRIATGCLCAMFKLLGKDSPECSNTDTNGGYTDCPLRDKGPNSEPKSPGGPDPTQRAKNCSKTSRWVQLCCSNWVCAATTGGLQQVLHALKNLGSCSAPVTCFCLVHQQAHPGNLPVPPAPGQQPGGLQPMSTDPGGAPMPNPAGQYQREATAPGNAAPTQQGPVALGVAAPVPSSGADVGLASQQGLPPAAGTGAAADPFKAAERQSRSLPAMAPRTSRISRVGQGQAIGEGKSLSKQSWEAGVLILQPRDTGEHCNKSSYDNGQS
jgi:hypothetical protein